jgi:hypothetical protein
LQPSELTPSSSSEELELLKDSAEEESLELPDVLATLTALGTSTPLIGPGVVLAELLGSETDFTNHHKSPARPKTARITRTYHPMTLTSFLENKFSKRHFELSFA